MLLPDNNMFFSTIQTFLSKIKDAALDVGAIVVYTSKNVYSQLDDLHVVCIRYGWCFTPDFPLHELLESSLIVQNSVAPQHALYRRIREYLNANDWHEVHQMLKSSRSSHALGRRRQKIVLDCLYTLKLHGRDHFNAANVVVSPLIGVIDGMIADFAQEKLGISNWHTTKGKRAVRGALDATGFEFDRPGIALLFDVLFSATNHVDRNALSNRRFNRHLIQHGNWLEFGRIEYVLRLILLVFFTAYIIDEYASREAMETDSPVTEKSAYSKYLSENILAVLEDAAIKRLAARGLQLPQRAPPTPNRAQQ